ncbi:odorant receptor 82a-like [Episyrphus balteatus]|uniref:odorant receptor 82a-like n=1 Tax=Episyrphus balteatus TaxID=286459 RepID=UPI0024852E16|nr:odorant receptor 82a-like [Episyrphus balteatus]
MGHSLNLKKKDSLFEQVAQYSLIVLVISCLHPIASFAIYNKNNIDKVTAGMSLIFIVILNSTKMATFLVNKRKFLEVMAELKDMWKNNSDVTARRRLKEVNTFSDRMVNSYFYAMIWSTTYFLASPLMKLAWAKITNQPFVRQWITPMRFIFDAETPPYYEFAIIYTSCVSIPVVVHLLAIDGLFVSFTANLCAHFMILQHNIETNEFTENNSIIHMQISSFVKYHIKILEVASKIYEAYKPIIFGQFVMTSLQVCVIVYQITTHMDSYVVLITNVLFLLTVLIQLLIYCYGGEIVKLESLNVGTSVQLTKWYRLQPKYQKMLCLIMMRSQKAFIMRVGFYDASLASFMLIIKAASSYITLIQSLE